METSSGKSISRSFRLMTASLTTPYQLPCLGTASVSTHIITRNRPSSLHPSPPSSSSSPPNISPSSHSSNLFTSLDGGLQAEALKWSKKSRFQKVSPRRMRWKTLFTAMRRGTASNPSASMPYRRISSNTSSGMRSIALFLTLINIPPVERKGK